MGAQCHSARSLTFLSWRNEFNPTVFGNNIVGRIAHRAAGHPVPCNRNRLKGAWEAGDQFFQIHGIAVLRIELHPRIVQLAANGALLRLNAEENTEDESVREVVCDALVLEIYLDIGNRAKDAGVNIAMELNDLHDECPEELDLKQI